MASLNRRGEKLVEMTQTRTGNLNRQHLVAKPFLLKRTLRRRCFQRIARRLASALGGTFHAANDAIGVSPIRTTQLFDSRLHALQRMRRQQLQDTHVLPHAGARPMPFFQTLAKLQKYSRKLPVTVHVRVIQRCGTTLQSRQIVQRIEHLIAGLIAPLMRRHDRVLMDDLHAIDVSLHRHRLKSTLPRNAVTHIVKLRELVLVDLRVLAKARIETVLRYLPESLPSAESAEPSRTERSNTTTPESVR